MKNSTSGLSSYCNNFLRLFEKKVIFKNLLRLSFLICPLLSVAGESNTFTTTNHGLNNASIKNSNPFNKQSGHLINNRLFSGPVNLPATSDITESIRTNLYLLMDDGSTVLADGVYAEYNDLYHDSVTLEDATKFTNILENIGLLRHDKTLSVERRPIIHANDTLFFKLWKTKQRNYQIEFVTDMATNTGLQAFFEDSYLNTSTALGLNETIKINFAINADVASASANRFKIVFKPKPLYKAPSIIFTSLNASQEGQKIAVKWKVTNETDVAKYEIEKSINGTDFSTVTTTANSVSGNYVWLDDKLVSGTNYYRIKSVNLNGSSVTTPVIKLVASKSGASFIVYPNPVKGNIINLQFVDQMPGIYQVKLINISGQVMYASKLPVNSNSLSQSLKVGTVLQRGIYRLEIKNANNSTLVKTIMVQ